MAEQNHIILIKNMVCNRCVLVVTEMLKGLHLTPLNVELGKAVVQEELKPDDWKNIKEALEKYGLTINVCASSNRFGLQSSNWYITKIMPPNLNCPNT